MIMNVIVGNAADEPADLEDLQDWSGEYGLTMPVLSDPNGAWVTSHITTSSYGLPYVVLLDQGVVIDTLEWATVEDAVELAEDNAAPAE